MSEYYRGSSSYELAVKNRLRSLEASGAATTNAIRRMESSVSSDIRASTYAIVASQQELARTFQHGFNAVNNTISFGFEMMNSKFDMVGEKLDLICNKLDEIHDIVNNPLLTASRELYRRALTNYEKGYFEEALEDCKAAVEKNKTDFISWNLLGQIYLFGAGKFSNVINLDEAENAFFTAAKYIDADIGKSSEANHLASEIYYYLGYTKLVKSNDYLVESKIDDSNKKLVEAESSSGRSYKISKDNLLAGYEQAKELHFLERDDEALEILEEVIRAEKNYALKASCDKNFESLWGRIDELVTRLRDELAFDVKKSADEYETKINSLIGVDKYWNEKFGSIKDRFSDFNCIEEKDYFYVRFLHDEVIKTLIDNFEKNCDEFIAENDDIANGFIRMIISKFEQDADNYLSCPYRKGHFITNEDDRCVFVSIDSYKNEFLPEGIGLWLNPLSDKKMYIIGGHKDCHVSNRVKRYLFDNFEIYKYKNEEVNCNIKLINVIEDLKKRTKIPLLQKHELVRALSDYQKYVDSFPEGELKQSACYVATAVYGSYDCPQVWTLRRYRDYKLAETWYGRAFIHSYYAISPTIVKWFGETNWFKALWRGKLDRMVKKLQSRGFESTPYNDRVW